MLRSIFSEYGNIRKIKDNKLTWRRIIDEFLSRFLHFRKWTILYISKAEICVIINLSLCQFLSEKFILQAGPQKAQLQQICPASKDNSFLDIQG